MTDSLRDSILLTRADGVATLTFNRPDALNALDNAMAVELCAQLERLTQDRTVRAIVLTGAGRAFMAGGDVEAMRSALDLPEARRTRAIGKLVRHAQLAVATLARSPKPVMASVNGAAAGFGLALVAACDVAIAADHATFTSAYNKLGASPDGGATFNLPRLLGARVAAQWLYLDEHHSAADALRVGLVNWVVPAAELASATRERAERLAALSPAAFTTTKHLIADAPGRTLDAQLLAEQRGFLACTSQPDFREGSRAFVERRAPHFVARATIEEPNP
ncbi:enoyl-CoA hydratase-related protein [Burkholderia sp. Ax-1719]|uniref:enoyl-CoA hydratase/isomerase family protein n=1 Tax=Burkholderia sp. Ax-1719 TaxID=2608334 RepID=UPI00141F0D23|nr:enoyl-CoA hydratase-related protein [Burkholderia sp. Ax-1719]NIE63669.1 enoyl-CoA hydratase [Burkholderia sp. Ax-1719]